MRSVSTQDPRNLHPANNDEQRNDKGGNLLKRIIIMIRFAKEKEEHTIELPTQMAMVASMRFL